jgi:hypothetical protein
MLHAVAQRALCPQPKREVAVPGGVATPTRSGQSLREDPTYLPWVGLSCFQTCLVGYSVCMADLKTKCARCRHSYSFHGKGTSPCKATGCHSSAGAACEGFVEPAEAKALSVAS